MRSKRGRIEMRGEGGELMASKRRRRRFGRWERMRMVGMNTDLWSYG